MSLLSIEVVDTKDITAQIRHLDMFYKTTDRELMKAMRSSNSAIKSRIRPLMSHFTGRAQKSLASKVTREGMGDIRGWIGGRGRNRFWLMLEEQGRAPGKAPRADRLEPYVASIVGNDLEEIQAVSFMMAQAIGAKGTKGTGAVEKGYEAAKGEVNALFMKAMDRIVEALHVR